MDVFFLIIILTIIYKSKLCKKNFNYNYLHKENTLCINGVFVLLVFCRHILAYCSFDSKSSIIFDFINTKSEQLIVVSFLLYSGYGIIESIKNKDNYVNMMPKRRMLKIYLMFTFAIFNYLIINLLLNINYDVKQIILSFIAWESIGNSNWYIFTILFLYFFTYISFKTFKDEKKSTIATTILTILFICYVRMFKYNFWYNTALCFPLGMWISIYKQKINNLFMKDNQKYLFALLISVLFFYISYKNHNIGDFYYQLWSLNFALIIIFITMKLHINNRILLFLGKNTFWIYILQRIPMIILQRVGIQKNSSYIYVIICFIITILLSIGYEKIFKNIFKKRRYVCYK